MEYKFIYQTKAKDLWQLSIYQIYTSILGICNLVFTVAMILLAVKFFNQISEFPKAVLLFACVWFPILHPFSLYIQARSKIKTVKENINILFNESGVHVNIEDRYADIKWTEIKQVTVRPTLLIIYSDPMHGYVLSNDVLGKQKTEVYQYILNNIKK